MILKAPTCPVCRGPARTIAESIETRAHLRRISLGSYEYDQWTDTDLHWDTAAPLTDGQGRVSLYCDLGHHWRSEVIPVAPPVEAPPIVSPPSSGPPPLPARGRRP